MLKAQAFTGGNLFINGLGLLGELVDVELPKLEKDTIETSSGIGKGEITLPTLKTLTTKITVNNVSELYLNMLDNTKEQEFYLKANASSTGGANTSIIATFRGYLKSIDSIKFEFNKEANYSFEATVNFYKLEIDDKTVIRYDFENNICEINGIDQYEQIRKNIN